MPDLTGAAHDPDLLAIQRKRRQQGRCLRCATRVPRAALCVPCRADWRYCPRCERVHPIAESSQRDDARRATSYCLPCDNVITNGVRPSRAERHAAERARLTARLAKALPLYRRGVPTRAIAAQLGMSEGALSGMISRARWLGLWPADLRRLPPRSIS